MGLIGHDIVKQNGFTDKRKEAAQISNPPGIGRHSDGATRCFLALTPVRTEKTQLVNPNFLDFRHLARQDCKLSFMRAIFLQGTLVLDDRNLAILALLQADADTPVGEIASQVKMSISACSRRIGQLRTDGYIKANVAILDRKLLGVPMTVFVLVKAGRHAEEWIVRFKNLIATIPEVQEAHRLAGSFDYIMKLALPDIDAYDSVYKRLVRTIEPLEISGHVAMETMKEGAILPLSYAGDGKTANIDT